MHAIAKVDPRFKEFKALVQRGVEAWVHAGKLLVAMTAGNPNVFDEIMADNPLLSRSTLEMFLRIGRMEVLPMLLINPSPGAQRLAKLPYLVQTRLWDQDVFVERLNSKVPIDKLTPGDAAVVLGPAGVRTPQEQRVMLRSVGAERERTGQRAPFASAEPRAKPEPDEPGPQEANETDPADDCLRIAQNALLAARVKMGEGKIVISLALDSYITTALRAIGSLRFEMGEASKKSEKPAFT